MKKNVDMEIKLGLIKYLEEDTLMEIEGKLDWKDFCDLSEKFKRFDEIMKYYNLFDEVQKEILRCGAGFNMCKMDDAINILKYMNPMLPAEEMERQFHSMVREYYCYLD